jgi:hypothetical protein
MVAPLALAAAGVVGAVIALKRLPQQETFDVVNTQSTLLGDMKMFNEVVTAECERLRERERELVEQLEASVARAERSARREEQLERELTECRARRALLEGEIQRRGLEGLGS